MVATTATVRPAPTDPEFRAVSPFKSESPLLTSFFQSDEKYTVPVIIYTDVLTINSGLISSNIFVPKV